MIRMQVRLTQAQTDKVKRIAAVRGVSRAEVVREAIDRLVDRDDRAQRWARALAAAGTGRDRDGATDVSVRHDDYLAEIYAHGTGPAVSP